MQPSTKVKFPLFTYILALVVFLLVGAASLTFEIPIKRLLVEAVQTFNSKFYIGFLSNLTCITWAVGAYCSLFAWWLLKRSGGPADWQRFFLMAGCFTAVLMLDDLFMFHERIFPKHLYLDRLFGKEPNEKLPVACYGLFAIYFLYSNRQTILKTNWMHLIIALGLLAFSVLVDRGIGKRIIPNPNLQAYLEEGSKFLGVVGWSAYYTQHAARICLDKITNAH